MSLLKALVPALLNRQTDRVFDMKKVMRKTKAPDVVIDDSIAIAGNSIVYKGHTKDFNVALKMIRIKEMPFLKKKAIELLYSFRKQLASDIGDVKRPKYLPVLSIEHVLHERNMLSENKHEHILKFYDSYYTKQFYFLVTELAAFSAEDLKLTDKEDFEMPFNLALHIAAPILKALAFLHRKNIAHLDVKPDNILINHFGVPKLGDFGSSYLLHGKQKTDLIGTKGFMAPELYVGKTFNEKVDIHSFGVTLKYLVRSVTTIFSTHEQVGKWYDKISKQEVSKQDKGAWGMYNLAGFSRKISDEKKKYYELIRKFILFKACDRPSAEQACKLKEIEPFIIAWEQRKYSNLFNENVKLIKLQGLKTGVDFDPINLLFKSRLKFT